MKRLLCLMPLLLPLAGCALCEDLVAFSEREWHKYTADTGSPCDGPTQARACGADPIIPAQTAEPPR